MHIFLRRNGHYLGVEPTPVPGRVGNAAYPVYANRDAGGGWEVAEATRHDTWWDVRFVDANRQLTITPWGLESRPAGAIGINEQLQLTEQPEGIALAYCVIDRRPLPLMLTIEAAS